MTKTTRRNTATIQTGKNLRKMRMERRDAQSRHREALRARLRDLVSDAATPQVLLDEIWNSDSPYSDLDKLVDDYAASHYAEGYRKRSIQKREISRRWEAAARVDSDVNSLLEDMYSRYLLAADIGFEMGFMAANKLAGR